MVSIADPTPITELTVGGRPVHRLSVDDVLRMVAAGVLDEDTPVELLDGILVAVSPKSAEHQAAVTLLLRWLRALDDRYDLRVEGPLAVPDEASLPEPDLAVVQRAEDLHRHPTTALLVVEVAVTSQAADTTVKPRLYALAGVPDYWVIDVPRRRVEVRRDPDPDAGVYRSVATLAAEQMIEPLGIDVAPLDLAAFFEAL
jgi:Uma2 family endonuclease